MQRFQPGDEVNLIGTARRGIVLDRQPPDHYRVQTHAGIVTVAGKELRLVAAETKPAGPSPDGAVAGVHLAFCLTEAGRWEEFDVWLVNNTDYHFRFHYRFSASGAVGFRFQSVVRRQQRFVLHSIAADQLNDRASFELELDNQQVLDKPMYVKQKLRPGVFFRGISYLEFLNKEGKLYSVYTPAKSSANPDPKIDLSELALAGRLANSKLDRKPRDARRRIPEDEVLTVDLHAENLPAEFLPHDRRTVLEAQLRYAVQMLDEALKLGMRKIIFVHGVGTGILRARLQDELRNLGFDNLRSDWHPLHGFGATEVILR